MEKIENVTCIKFEDNSRNQHQEPFLLGESIFAACLWPRAYNMPHIGGSTSQCDTWSRVEPHENVTLCHVSHSNMVQPEPETGTEPRIRQFDKINTPEICFIIKISERRFSHILLQIFYFRKSFSQPKCIYHRVTSVKLCQYFSKIWRIGTDYPSSKWVFQAIHYDSSL